MGLCRVGPCLDKECFLPKKLPVHFFVFFCVCVCFFFETVPKLNLSHLAYTRPSVAGAAL